MFLGLLNEILDGLVLAAEQGVEGLVLDLGRVVAELRGDDALDASLDGRVDDGVLLAHGGAGNSDDHGVLALEGPGQGLYGREVGFSDLDVLELGGGGVFTGDGCDFESGGYEALGDGLSDVARGLGGCLISIGRERELVLDSDLHQRLRHS